MPALQHPPFNHPPPRQNFNTPVNGREGVPLIQNNNLPYPPNPNRMPQPQVVPPAANHPTQDNTGMVIIIQDANRLRKTVC